MSVENNVFVRRESLPAPDAWRQAIRDAGFDMELDSDFDWDGVEGFLPCRYKGGEGGFGLYADALDRDGFSAEELAEIGDRDFVVSLVTGSDFREYMTSMIASAVLCSICNGLLAEGGEALFIPAPEAVEWAKLCEPSVEKMMLGQEA